MNATQYAAHRGVNPAMVTKWLKNGFLKGAYTKKGAAYVIDHVAADALLAQTHGPTAPKKTLDGPVTFAEARRRKEEAAAELRELELAEKRGQLVPKDEIEREAFNVARQIRDQLLAIPSRISPQLAAMTDSYQIDQLLTVEIRNALEALSK